MKKSFYFLYIAIGLFAVVICIIGGIIWKNSFTKIKVQPEEPKRTKFIFEQVEPLDEKSFVELLINEKNFINLLKKNKKNYVNTNMKGRDRLIDIKKHSDDFLQKERRNNTAEEQNIPSHVFSDALRHISNHFLNLEHRLNIMHFDDTKKYDEKMFGSYFLHLNLYEVSFKSSNIEKNFIVVFNIDFLKFIDAEYKEKKNSNDLYDKIAKLNKDHWENTGKSVVFLALIQNAFNSIYEIIFHDYYQKRIDILSLMFYNFKTPYLSLYFEGCELPLKEKP